MIYKYCGLTLVMNKNQKILMRIHLMVRYSKEIKIGGKNMLNKTFIGQYYTFKSKIICVSNNTVIYVPEKELYIPDKQIVLFNKQTNNAKLIPIFKV